MSIRYSNPGVSIVKPLYPATHGICSGRGTDAARKITRAIIRSRIGRVVVITSAHDAGSITGDICGSSRGKSDEEGEEQEGEGANKAIHVGD